MSRADGGGEVEIAWEAGPRLVEDARIRAAAAEALAHGGRPGIGLSVVLVDDATLAGMHARWLDDPEPTDVITFDLGEAGGGAAGELYVSVERALAAAAERGHAPDAELLLYVVHGALHLCGHEDDAPAARARMRAAEGAVLARLGVDPRVASEGR